MVIYPRVAVGGIIIKEKKILLVMRRDEPDRNKWAIPGGKLELNETIEEGLKREMKEELSLDIEVGALAGISEFISLNFHYIIMDYMCNPLSKNVKPGSDALDAAYFDLENLDNSVNDSTREFIKNLNSSETPVHIINRKF